MNKLRVASLVLMVAIILSTSAFSQEPTPSEALNVVYSIPVGSGPNKCQIITDVEGGSPLGPQAIAIDTSDTLYLLDSVQSQILKVDLIGNIKTISIPYATYPKDIICTDFGFCILDSDPRILFIDHDGNLLASTYLPDGIGSVQVLHLFKKNGTYGFTTIENEEYTFDVPSDEIQNTARTGNIVISEFSSFSGRLDADGNSFDQRVDAISGLSLNCSNGKNINVTTEQIMGSAVTYIDDNLFVLVEEVASNSPYVIVETSLRKYSSDGDFVGVCRLPMDDNASYTINPIEITEDGEVFYLAPCIDYVNIYQVGFSETYQSELSDMVAEAYTSTGLQESELLTASQTRTTGFGTPSSRTVTRARCQTMANLT